MINVLPSMLGVAKIFNMDTHCVCSISVYSRKALTNPFPAIEDVEGNPVERQSGTEDS